MYHPMLKASVNNHILKPKKNKNTSAMFKEYPVTASMLVNEKHFRPRSRWMISTMLDCVRPVTLDIGCVERGVCFWLFWLSRLTSSSTVVTFSSVHACFSLPLSCLWSVLHISRMFLVKCPVLPFCSLWSKIRHYPPWTIFLELV